MSNDLMNSVDLNQFFSAEKDKEFTILRFNKNANKIIVYDPGLYHTAVCTSNLCSVDKQSGKLYYRGTDVVNKLQDDYLDVAFEIIFGSNESKQKFQKAVHAHFRLFDEQRALLDLIPLETHPMDILGMVTIALSGLEKKYMADVQDSVEKAGFLIAQVGISVSYLFTKINRLPWIDLPPNLSYAEQILFRMHAGKGPQRLRKLAKILNTIMILHAEHGQNCSAATVRNIASARSNIYCGVAAGMAAFNGAIHGGASQYVSMMYEELIANSRDIDSYVDEKIAKKDLLMGFGQRTYNRILDCWDPRVETMRSILMDPSFHYPEIEKYKQIALLLIDRISGDEFFKAKNLTPNPDLFNCIFYKLLGVPKEMNTCMLALGRIAGWVANFLEHVQDRYPLTRPCDMDN